MSGYAHLPTALPSVILCAGLPARVILAPPQQQPCPTEQHLCIDYSALTLCVLIASLFHSPIGCVLVVSSQIPYSPVRSHPPSCTIPLLGVSLSPLGLHSFVHDPLSPPRIADTFVWGVALTRPSLNPSWTGPFENAVMCFTVSFGLIFLFD